jgi:hypothetical protein
MSFGLPLQGLPLACVALHSVDWTQSKNLNKPHLAYANKERVKEDTKLPFAPLSRPHAYESPVGPPGPRLRTLRQAHTA